MALYEIDQKSPQIDPTAWVFESAVLIGDVILGPRASVWPNVSIRGDNTTIRVGAGTNIQEGSVLHVDADAALTIHENVTVGHQAMLHGCTIHSGCLIGMQAIVLSHAVIGKNCLIGAGAIVPEGREIPDGSLVIGVGKVVRSLSEEEIKEMHLNNLRYQERAAHFAKTLKRVG
jgi:carbonic anhydrase/acetyltransferase-like protein (isoleucine patch superfamily)